MSWDNFLAAYVADSGTQDIALAQIPSVEPGEKHLFFKPSMLLSAGANTEHTPRPRPRSSTSSSPTPRSAGSSAPRRASPPTRSSAPLIETEEGSVDARVIAYEEAVTEQVTESTIPVKGFSRPSGRRWARLAYGTIAGRLRVAVVLRGGGCAAS